MSKEHTPEAPIRFAPAEGETLGEMRANFRKTDLFRAGDASLVWVNQGDLYMPPAQDDRKVVVTTDEVAEALTYALEIIETKEQRIANLESALEWYGEQSRLVRLIHNEGDKGRQALADDGGRRARAILSATPSHPMKEED